MIYTTHSLTHSQRVCNQWKKGGGTKIFKHKRIFQHLARERERRQQQEKHPLEGVCVYFINLKSTPKQKRVLGPSATFNMIPQNVKECQLSHTMFMQQ